MILVNLSNQVFTINRGDRIAQLVLTKYEKINWKIIKELPRPIVELEDLGVQGKNR